MSESKDSIVDLISAVEAKSKNVHTQSLDLSFNELLDMKKSKELNITPDFQRLFRWTEGSRSRFIESLLLEMPVPPIYVVEEANGSYILIDGLQRISSYLHLRGELEADHLDQPVKIGEKLVLTDCDIVRELNGKTYDDLGTALQIRLKRAFVRVEVVRKGSDPHFKYHMFKRLNTGGEILSPQQVRNCTIRLLNPKFIDFTRSLSTYKEYEICTEYLTYEQRLAAFNEELILRFFALKNNRNGFKHDVSDFLTDYMEAVSDPLESKINFDYEKEKLIFEKTFSILANTLGDLSFGYPNRSKKISRAFGIYQYEAFVLGLQPYLDKIELTNKDLLETLSKCFEEIKLNAEFITMTTGGGKNSKGPLRDRVTFVEESIAKVLK